MSAQLPPAPTQPATVQTTPRLPAGDGELRRWLDNMVRYHRFTTEECAMATGLTVGEIESALRRWAIKPGDYAANSPDEPRLVLPYPGGRHPRLGFLEGAVDPQRETKASVFTPWDPASYVVVDVPEAIWTNLGLTYLAHTHATAPTIWVHRNITLEKQEWSVGPNGLAGWRRLPNGLAFTSSVTPERDGAAMELLIHNGTAERLTGLRAQVCVMFKQAAGFERQANAGNVSRPPFVARPDAAGRRWVITAWSRCHRVWSNPPCPCMHSDPAFDDAAPGETVRARGRLWFHEGGDIGRKLSELSRETHWPFAPAKR